MKILKLVGMVVMLITLGSLGSLACAGEMVVYAPYGFTAGQMHFPAGEYRVETYLPSQILIRNTTTGKGAIIPILARLNGRADGGAQAIFSKDGDQYHLSAVYLPGIDGFLLKTRVDTHSTVRLAESIH